MRTIREVADPELGMIRQLVEEDGTVVATATMSPPTTDGVMTWYDESHVWDQGGGLMPTLDEWRQLWGSAPPGPRKVSGHYWPCARTGHPRDCLNCRARHQDEEGEQA